MERNSRALVPYIAPKSFGCSKSKCVRAILSFSRCLTKSFGLRYCFYFAIFILYFWGFYIGCFLPYSDMTFCTGFDSSSFQLLFCVISFLFSFGILGVVSTPILCSLHSFFAGVSFVSATNRAATYTLLLFVVHFLTIVYYSETYVVSSRVLSGARRILLSKDTYIYFVIFVVLAAFLALGI